MKPEESILTSIKKNLGIIEEYEHFDPDIIMHINSILMVLTQIGVGNPEGFAITDKSETWEDFTLGFPNIEAVKSYVHLRVRMIFDPPAGRGVSEAINNTVSELEWRIHMEIDNAKEVADD